MTNRTTEENGRLAETIYRLLRDRQMTPQLPGEADVIETIWEALDRADGNP